MLQRFSVLVFSFSALIVAGCSNNQLQNIAAGSSFLQAGQTQQTQQSGQVALTQQNRPTGVSQEIQPAKPLLTEPISNALSRITKKTFGLKVSPGHSPVSPEKFSGYHTGVDFETLPDEQDTDVPIYAACDGKLLLKKIATGYGGVAVQSCTLDGQAVTIVYGHLRFSSIVPSVGESLTAGQQIAVLGKGYSTETDGERKHLHFGIHKGTAVNILGYVQSASQLSSWLDAQKYLQ